MTRFSNTAKGVSKIITGASSSFSSRHFSSSSSSAGGSFSSYGPFISGSSFSDISQSQSVVPPSLIQKEVGRLPGGVYLYEGWLYLIKRGTLDGKIKNTDNFSVRREFMSSRIIEAALANDSFDSVVSPVVAMVKAGSNDGEYLLTASRIIALESYPNKQNAEAYGKRMFEVLAANKFSPFTSLALVGSLICSNDHPGLNWSNTGISSPSGRFVTFDFDVCFGYGQSAGPRADSLSTRVFADNNFIISFDIDRGIASIDNEEFNSYREFLKDPEKMSHATSLEISKAIFSHLTFNNVAASPLPSVNQINLIIDQGCSEALASENKEDLKSRNESFKRILSGRLKDAVQIRSVAKDLANGLDGDQIFPPAFNLVKFLKEHKLTEKLAAGKLPANTRQEIIDENSKVFKSVEVNKDKPKASPSQPSLEKDGKESDKTISR